MQLRPRVARAARDAAPTNVHTASTTGTSALNPHARIQSELLALADPQYAVGVTRFFKSAYSRGDVFLGVRVPQCRATVRAHLHAAARAEIVALLQDERHEMRLAGGICVVEAFAAPLNNARWLVGAHDSDPEQQQEQQQSAGEGDTSVSALSEQQRQQQQVVEFYLEHLACFDNWDLVDTTCPKVLGAWMAQRHLANIEQFCQHVDAAAAPASSSTEIDVESERTQLADAMRELPRWYQELLVSTDFWETRVSIVLLLGIHKQRADFALHICRWQLLRLLGGERPYEQRIKGELFADYDLVHKACGWVLRECGKTDRPALLRFLARYASLTPRTTLQYATEHLDRTLAKSLSSQGRVTSKRARTVSGDNGADAKGVSKDEDLGSIASST